MVIVFYGSDVGCYANGLEDARSLARRVRFNMPVR
jgi:hypothetical protein